MMRTTWRSTGPLDFAGSPNLLAEGDALALADELRQIPLDSVERHAGHRDRLPGRLPAGRQGDIEQRGRTPCVLEEQLVEISHPVEEQDVRVLALDAQVLLHHGRVRAEAVRDLGHERIKR
jgi:hypothetical protein